MNNRLTSLLLIWMWMATAASAQTTTVEAVVVDALTSQPLPYTSIFVSRTNSTITNAEGQFSISCQPSDVLRISYVGYKTIRLTAEQTDGLVKLMPMTTSLGEVTVRPYNAYLKEAIKETERQLKKNKKQKANFFYRQTAYADSVCYEFMEAFLCGRSAVWLRELALNKGRFAGIQPDSTHYYSFYANFFSTSQLQLMAMPGHSVSANDRYPLTKYYDSYYDLSFSMMGSGDDRLLAVHFRPKPTDKPILDAILYFDATTFRLRKMEGDLLNMVILHREQRGDRNMEKLREAFNQTSYDDVIDTEYHFVVTMTEERNFLEVESVVIDEEHQLHGKTIHTHSLLFNIGDREIGRGKQLGSQANLHDVIEAQGYDPTFWEENEIVLRTPVEQQVLELFEGKKLFGIF